ncbi:glycosyltransferase [Xinfangfangia sp. CPCC 101601]|uniref:Glycosyltransferase n=1 Tax=Pseudogemmobacter lacusdianii TaxID=3069608 RepID=A0ABU0VWX1_9RHOB|nr:glycosyltransferase [Xinfangfangia sp. CPCC 101601]MDQ2066242.1 glycosyltransferase [Xinfangfangia sp. CPCC 101601]
MKLAYLVNTYPQPSHSFIRREVQALERMEWQIHRFALRSNRAALVDAADLAEETRTEHILKQGLGPLLRQALPFALRRPAATWRSLRLALACGARGAGGPAGTGGRLRHLIYWLEGAYLAARCHALRLPHIHAHFGTNSATVAMLAAELGGLRFSMTVHGPEEFDAPHAHNLAEKTARAAFTVAISSFGRGQLCRWADLAHWRRIYVVHCGIEPWRFPAPAPLPQTPPKLVAIGRLTEQKGIPLLIEAMALVARQRRDLHLTLIGDGPFRSLLEAQIARAGLQQQITLTGWLDEAGVRDHLAQAHALVLPSFAEGLPMVVMEAFAAGRPVIASAINGVPELVTADTGWLVPSGDPQALATALLTFAATPPERLQAMGLAARDRVLARHDIQTEAEKLTELFASGGRA